MERGFNPDNAGKTDVVNERTGTAKNNSLYRMKKSADNKNDDHFSEGRNEYHVRGDIKNGRGVENLSFQEWTEKYHQ